MTTHDAPAPPERHHAIVLGASMAGLLAARVLSDHFHRVTVIERDPRPEPGAARRGVPQGDHVHVLLEAGQVELARLFPDLLAEMRRDRERLVRIDFVRDLAWRHAGVWKLRFDSRYEAFPQARPVLEERVRRRVETRRNVRVLWGSACDGLAVDQRAGRVSGVTVRAGGPRRHLPADLVVDATGRGSRTPGWLLEHGYPGPAEEAVPIGLAYTTAVFRRPAPYPHDWQALYVSVEPPAIRRGGVITAIDPGRWMVTLMGYAGDHAPADPAGFLAFARGLADPAIADALRGVELLGPPRRFQVPRQVRRRYERLAVFPEGLLVLGDALCVLDPVFGQGMSVAALEARALAELLARRGRSGSGRDPLRGLARAFHRRAARIVETPWMLTSLEAFRFPEIEGERPPGIGLLHRYGTALARGGSRSEALHRTFLELMHLEAPKELLLHPAVVARVALDAWRARRREPDEPEPEGVGGALSAR